MPLLDALPVDGPLPRLAGKCKGPALVIGCARGVWDDLAAIGDRDFPGHVMAVNYMGIFYDRTPDHWSCAEAGQISHWQVIRRNGHLIPFHSTAKAPGVSHVWPIAPLRGTSGLFATVVTVLMGYAPVILCGMPLDGRGHFYDRGDTTTANLAPAVRQAWERLLPHLKGTVFSMSGQTRDWFGAP